ncbi:hypothetical protein BDW02DRAFT_569615 [Decorospora gaudefroyi]|uniref:Uncharacterized protein n=1 Tax=Decorospora gaudefroyi TaxID=184978 RepID=A0A6A5KBT1_9PLEO|nr:hypothetical protein BDW02DRAFT_569615 [Decorospora gaudefroyi]
MRMYFSRTLRTDGSRTLTVKQLRTELDVYLWTTLQDWLEEYDCGSEGDAVIEVNGPACMDVAISGVPEAVLAFWRERVEELIGAMVWRNKDVRPVRLEKLFYTVLRVIAFLLYAFGSFHLASMVLGGATGWRFPGR